MRIIAGRLKGRLFDSPGGHRTHPMSDKMRGALFNTLGDIDGLSVLDAFAGSGALGLEALSRGASMVVAVDIDERAVSTIKQNAVNLGLVDQLTTIRAGLESWAKRPDWQQFFDLVISDPPYDDLQLQQVQTAAQFTRPGGVFVVSLPPAAVMMPAEDFSELIIKNYGDSSLRFYRRTRLSSM